MKYLGSSALAHTACCKLRLAPLYPGAVLRDHPQTQHLQYPGGSTETKPALSLVARPGLSSRALTLPPGPRLSFSPYPLQTLGLHSSIGCTFSSSLSGLFTEPHLLSRTALIPMPSSHQNQSSGRLIHITTFSLQPEMQPWSPLDQLLGAEPEEILPENFSSVLLVSY